MNNKLDKYLPIYENELRERVIPFWERNCPDRRYGAYFTCLDRDGSVYDTEKFMWMQWRIVWMFSELYNKLEQNPRWLELAELGYQFLTRYGRDEQGRYYFALAQDGQPTMAPYSVFSECFAVMGCAAYYRATGDESAKVEAVCAFDNYLQREARPKGEWTKGLSGRKSTKSLGFYMMKANLYVVLEECLGDASFTKSMLETVSIVLDEFWNDEHKVMFENVGFDGVFDLDSTIGRHLNPGHAIEAMWFIMSAAARTGNIELINRAADVVLAELDFGWDKEYGGIYYFMDVLGKPHVELQCNMKLWWVHNEALIATAMAYKMTGREEFLHWFERIHEWTWCRFPDPEYGEWYGYLDRRGDVANSLKGGKWKGFFHLPRMLLVCSKMFDN
ncbi:MAG: AGE family epimerase/isomerase [Armatimonadota bacterium]